MRNYWQSKEYILMKFTKEELALVKDDLFIVPFKNRRKGEIVILSVKGWQKIVMAHKEFVKIEQVSIKTDSGDIIGYATTIHRKPALPRPVTGTAYLSACPESLAGKLHPEIYAKNKSFILAAKDFMATVLNRRRNPSAIEVESKMMDDLLRDAASEMIEQAGNLNSGDEK